MFTRNTETLNYESILINLDLQASLAILVFTFLTIHKPKTDKTGDIKGYQNFSLL